ncbi:hypothetical protein AAG906_025888 [Vitis piasezkii]
MFPPAHDPPDLGIPPNGGPRPSDKPRVVPPSTQCPPQGFGARAHRGAYVRFLTFFFNFYALFIVQEWSFLDGIKSGTSLKFG